MLLDLSEIPADGLELDHRIELREGAGDDGLETFDRPARLVARIRRGEGDPDLFGRIEATVTQECCRCLDPVENELNVEFFLRLVAEPPTVGAEEHRIAPDEASLFHAVDGKVDLREVVREQVLLNLPQKPLCRPDCAGLCPTCGSNRNRIECVCRSEDVDPRLAPLLELKRGEAVSPRSTGEREESPTAEGKDDGEP